MSKSSPTPREQFWRYAREEIAGVIALLKTRSVSELHRLIDLPDQREIQDANFTANLTSWAREHKSDKLGVLVEVKQARFGGLWHGVEADGFYIHADGSVETMREEDLWEHGY